MILQYSYTCNWMMYRYATPFGLTSEYAHPAEILFLGFATILGPAITGPHLFTLWLWMVVRVLETVEAHCGYHFPFSLSNFIPLYGGWVVFSSSLVLRLEIYLLNMVLEVILVIRNMIYLLSLIRSSIKLRSADFHDYHHRVLYTKSGNYSSTFVYMDW